MKKLFFLLFFLFSSTAFGLNEDFYSGQGEVTFEFRRFDNDNNRFTEETGVALFTRVETRYNDQKYQAVLRGYGRVDRKDKDRSLFVLEDGYVASYLDQYKEYRLLVGYKIFNWTATEAFHPADQINSRNLDGELENLEKKGELTVELEMPLLDGFFKLFYWPRFEPPTIPSSTSRLGTGIEDLIVTKPVVVDGTDSDSNDHWVHQFGLRATQTWGSFDGSFHIIHHINRNFPLTGSGDYGDLSFTIPFVGTFDVFTSFTSDFTPFFYRSTQVGGTGQLATGSLLSKLEFAYRAFEKDFAVLDLYEAPADSLTSFDQSALMRPSDHLDVALGFEYSIFHGTGDSTIFLEGTTLFGPSSEERVRMTIFQSDIFIGYRYAFNDVMGSEIFASTIFDTERSHERIYSASFTRRISDVWKYKFGLRVYDAPRDGQIPRGLEQIGRGDYGYFNLTRYF